MDQEQPDNLYQEYSRDLYRITGAEQGNAIMDLLQPSGNTDNNSSVMIPPDSIGSGFDTSRTQSSQQGNVILGGLNVSIDNKNDIQSALDLINKNGGGTLYLKAGTYTPTTNITIRSGISLVGSAMSTTIIDFGSADRRFILAGTNIYTTGTVSITSGVTVTGVSTAWLTSGLVAGDQMFLQNRWYKIATIAGDTTIILAEGYAGSPLSGATYRAGMIVKDVEFEELTIKNSTSASGAIDGDDVRNILFDDLQFISNNVGFILTNFSEWATDTSISVANTSHGGSLVNGSVIASSSLTTPANGGSGMVLDNLSLGAFLITSSNGNTSDGFNLTNCDNVTLMPDCENNGGYGVNISTSTCDNIQIFEQILTGNTSGPINDAGVGTQVGQGTGTSPVDEKKFVYMKNTSGGQIDAGDVVVIKAVAAGNEVTTTATAGDSKIFGVVAETIANNASGRIQTLGKVVTLKVNGTTDIAVGDLLSTFTTAKIAQKASAGDTAFAIALEAYATDDSSGVLDALLIKNVAIPVSISGTLGSWTSATADGNGHQVTTDGFLVGYINTTADTSNATTILTDSNSTPTTVRQSIKNTSPGYVYNTPFMCPVKKNDYYKISVAVNHSATAFFIPLGS